MFRKKVRFAPLFFLAAPLFFFTVWIIAPAFFSIYVSFTKMDIVSPTKFVGLYNYKVLFSDSIFYRCLINNLKWIIIYLTVPISIGLALALGLNNIKRVQVLKVVFYLPMAISLIAVSLIWAWMYNPVWGIINVVLRRLGLDFLTRAWLADPSSVLYAVVFASCWNFIPLIVITFSAGLTSIPPELMEAAKIDGANSLQQLRHVTIPLLRPAFTIAIVLTVITSLRAFDIVYSMTGGGPANFSNVLSVYMFHEAFHDLLLGYGSAIAVILTIISSVFVIIYLNNVLKKEISY